MAMSDRAFLRVGYLLLGLNLALAASSIWLAAAIPDWWPFYAVLVGVCTFNAVRLIPGVLELRGDLRRRR